MARTPRIPAYRPESKGPQSHKVLDALVMNRPDSPYGGVSYRDLERDQLKTILSETRSFREFITVHTLLKDWGWQDVANKAHRKTLKNVEGGAIEKWAKGYSLPDHVHQGVLFRTMSPDMRTKCVGILIENQLLVIRNLADAREKAKIVREMPEEFARAQIDQLLHPESWMTGERIHWGPLMWPITTQTDYFKAMRQLLGPTQDELAQETGLDRNFIAQIENDNFKQPLHAARQRLIQHFKDAQAEYFGLPFFDASRFDPNSPSYLQPFSGADTKKPKERTYAPKVDRLPSVAELKQEIHDKNIPELAQFGYVLSALVQNIDGPHANFAAFSVAIGQSDNYMSLIAKPDSKINPTNIRFKTYKDQLPFSDDYINYLKELYDLYAGIKAGRKYDLRGDNAPGAFAEDPLYDWTLKINKRLSNPNIFDNNMERLAPALTLTKRTNAELGQQVVTMADVRAWLAGKSAPPTIEIHSAFMVAIRLPYTREEFINDTLQGPFVPMARLRMEIEADYNKIKHLPYARQNIPGLEPSFLDQLKRDGVQAIPPNTEGHTPITGPSPTEPQPKPGEHVKPAETPARTGSRSLPPRRPPIGKH